MSLMRKFTPIVAAVSLSLSLSATPAFADAITLDSGDVGTSFSLNFNGFADGTVINNLAAVATFTLQAVTGSSYTFAYSITNSTGTPLTSRISSFAFNTDPTIASASSTGAFSYTTLNSSYPNGIGSVDVCFKDAKTGSCSGGGSGGLLAGETGTGAFTLNFSQPLSSLTLSDFFVRYQSITGAGNVTSASGSGTLTGSTSGGTPVPEPGMLGLFGAALIGVGLMRRRKKLPLAA